MGKPSDRGPGQSQKGFEVQPKPEPLRGLGSAGIVIPPPENEVCPTGTPGPAV